VATQTDGNGNTDTLSYGVPSANEVSVRDPQSNTAIFHTQGRDLLGLQDPSGATLAYSYDANSRPLTQTDRLGDSWDYTYHAPTGLTQSVTRSDGSKFTFAYAAVQSGRFTFYDVSSLTYPDGSSEQYQYDQAGNLISRTDQLGKIWTYTRNSQGQPLTMTVPSGSTFNFTYGDDATMTSIQVPGAGTWHFGHDALKRVTSLTNPDGTVRSYSFDPRDLLTAITNEAGNTRTLARDSNGLLSKFTDALGDAYTFTRAGTDHITRTTDPLSNHFDIAYNADDEEASLALADGTQFTFGYDAALNRISVTDPASKVWKRTVDGNGFVLSNTTPAGNRTTQVHDPLGRITQLTTPLGNKTSYAYDSLGYLASAVDPLGRQTSLSHDALQNLTGILMADGAQAQYTLDPLGRITAITDPNGSAWHMSRDGAERLISLIDPLGNTQNWTRDSRGQIVKAQLPGGGSLSLTHNPVGLVTQASYSDGTVLNYQYDARNAFLGGTGLALEYDSLKLVSNSNGIGITRDPVGRIAQLTLASGKTVTYAYDPRGLASKVTDWLGGVTTFAYDDDGLLLSITRPNGVVTLYQHDAEGRVTLLQEGKNGSSIASTSLTRDAAGQLIQAERNLPLEPSATAFATQGPHNFDSASQIVDIKNFAYDGLGRRTNDDRNAYQWDLASRLLSTKSGTTTSQFAYNCLGLMISANGQQFVWNWAFDLPSISILQQGSSDSRYFVHTPEGNLLYSVDAATGKRSFYHFDEMGNTLFLTDDTGAITDSYAYSPYGALVASTGSTDNPFTFGGQQGVQSLGKTGLYAMRRRVYDSATASYLSRESTIQLDPRMINPYQYAMGNPLYFMDATGREPEAPASQEPSGGSSGVEAATQTVTFLTDVVHEVAERTAVGGEVTEALAHASDYIEINKAEEANEVFKVLMKDLPKVEKAEKVLKVAAPLKVVNQLIEGGMIIKENVDAQNEAFEENEKVANADDETYNDIVDGLRQAYNNKQIGAARLHNESEKARLECAFQQDMADISLDIDLTTAFAIGIKNAAATLQPIPKTVLGWFGLNPEDKLKKH